MIDNSFASISIRLGDNMFVGVYQGMVTVHLGSVSLQLTPADAQTLIDGATVALKRLEAEADQ